MESIKNILRRSGILRNGIRFLRSYNAPVDTIIKSHRSMLALKNKYAGERCFVIGNGPSLCPEDLEKLKNEYCFAANRISRIFDKTSWRPSFYCVQDENMMAEMEEDFLQGSNVAQYSFIRLCSEKKVNDKITRNRNVIFVPIYEPVLENQGVRFTKKADRFVYDGWTVTYFSLQLAAYMGFKNIYLVGVDHNFPFVMDSGGGIHVNDKSLPAHFYESAADNEGNDAHKRRTSFYERTTNAYYAAEAFSRRDGSFRIYNATRGGKLEAFERVNFDDLFPRSGRGGE